MRFDPYLGGMSTAAETFRRLHAGPELLILPNGWDAGSCRVIETLGAKAVATSSAAVCWSHGYADGHHLPIELLAQTVAEITRVVSIPVTCDSEGGYADDPATVGENIARIVGAGAVGINIEDGRETPELHAAKITAVRKAADREGVPLFINARTDVYLKRLAEPEAAVDEVLRRAAIYRDAGADGLFAPGVVIPAEISGIAAGCGLPLNVMARPGLPAGPALQALGARRISSATGLARAALAALNAATAAFLATGDSDALAAADTVGGDYNKLFN
ncbi:MAG: isocitrate lyase/phosphoenolpyruvate mutase family protein [Caulobacter sp.]|nr:isocitrate lyase/phosphoenolpyruvate mutase family protein [Caulobacter sp.]